MPNLVNEYCTIHVSSLTSILHQCIHIYIDICNILKFKWGFREHSQKSTFTDQAEYTNKLFCDATAITSSFGCQAT